MSVSGIAELDAMIDRLRTLAGPDIGARVAAKAAPLVDAAIKKTVRAGQTPMGQAWKPKKDGGAPLVNAAAHIVTSPRGAIVASVLTGPDVFHHLGLGGKPRRQILPDGASVPEGVKGAVVEAAAQVFREVTSGGG